MFENEKGYVLQIRAGSLHLVALNKGPLVQPPLPSITGGTLCASNGPLQNPQSEVLPIKNKPKTMHHKNQRIQKPGVV